MAIVIHFVEENKMVQLQHVINAKNEVLQEIQLLINEHDAIVHNANSNTNQSVEYHNLLCQQKDAIVVDLNKKFTTFSILKSIIDFAPCVRELTFEDSSLE